MVTRGSIFCDTYHFFVVITITDINLEIYYFKFALKDLEINYQQENDLACYKTAFEFDLRLLRAVFLFP